jgi:hypothetical protein
VVAGAEGVPPPGTAGAGRRRGSLRHAGRRRRALAEGGDLVGGEGAGAGAMAPAAPRPAARLPQGRAAPRAASAPRDLPRAPGAAPCPAAPRPQGRRALLQAGPLPQACIDPSLTMIVRLLLPPGLDVGLYMRAMMAAVSE